MPVLAPNPTVTTPAGFLIDLPDPRLVLEVPVGSVWGREDVASLRQAAVVRLVPADARPAGAPGSGLSEDALAVRTVLALALAGVPVDVGGVTGVLDLLPRPLATLVEQAPARALGDRDRREALSLELRRAAWACVGHPRDRAQVAVILPPDPGEVLLADLAAQTGTDQVHLSEGPGLEQAVDDLAAEGVLYCCRPVSGLRIGPHHLADLVHAQRHSGAAVVHSPERFRPAPDGGWLVQEGGVEQLAGPGLAGGSLWLAADGATPPTDQGYAVSGRNAVRDPELLTGHETTAPVAWRWLTHRPEALDWLGEPRARDTAGSLPSAYRARWAATASTS